MDRATRLTIAHTLVDRTRDYTRDALNELFEAMGKIERKHDLIPKLSEEEEATVIAAEKRLERGEELEALKLSGRVEDFLPEPEASILGRLSAQPEEERDAIFGVISLLINIEKARAKLSLEQVADIRHRLKRMENRS
jgi:hypothetical protein